MATKKTAKTEKTTKTAKAEKTEKAGKVTKTVKNSLHKNTKSKAAKAPKPPKKAVVKKGPKPPKETQSVSARDPKAALAAKFGSKEALAKQLAPTLARGDQDSDVLAKQLTTASNAQLLRLQEATSTLKDKYGSREALIAAIGKAENKGSDKDYLAKLDTYSLPQLLDLAASAERNARA